MGRHHLYCNVNQRRRYCSGHVALGKTFALKLELGIEKCYLCIAKRPDRELFRFFFPCRKEQKQKPD